MALLALVSCANEPESQPEVFKGTPAVVDVTLVDMDQLQTRHNVSKTDNWTTTSFAGGDRIGMMATNGLVLPEGGTGWIKNGYLENTQALGSSTYRFRNDNLLLNTGVMTGKVARYVYYPYTDEMPVPTMRATGKTQTANQYDTANPKDSSTIDPDFQNKNGLLLRTTNTKDGTTRCVDYMYISNISLSNGALSGGFYHGFCELVILRGNGFDNPKTDYDSKNQMYRNEIRVVLDYGYTRLTLGIHLTYTTGQLAFQPTLWPGTSWSGWKDTEDKVDGLTEWEAKRWTAWPGEQYIDSKDGLPVPRDAWYVILPSAHSRTHPTVESIEIYNNDGTFCEVSNFDLYVDPTTGVSSKPSYAGKRFTVDIMMTEHGATARPVSIADWSDDDGEGVVKGEDGTEVNNKNDITDIRTVGINQNSVNEWVTKYNAYINAGSPHPADLTEASLTNLSDAEKTALAALKPYGDYIDRVWHFYITEDLTLPDYTLEKLVDVLEGASPVANYTISNLRSTPFNSISSRGALKNLDFDRLYVNVSASPDGEPNPVGALTNRLDGGTIENCHINNGTIIGPQGTPIGMLCGTVNGGTVKNCSVSGAVIGTIDSSSADDTRYKGLFGKVESAPTLESNDKSGLIVQSK